MTATMTKPKKTKKPTTEVETVKPKTTNSRAIWKGSISFGLINVPVAVYGSVKDYKFSLRQLRRTDLSPIRYKKVADADGVEVALADIIKGYEYEKDRFVVLTDSDLASINLPSLKTIGITSFVDADEIDTRLVEKSYFLTADKGGQAGYSILFAAMERTGKVGVAKIALRNREYLAVVRADSKRKLLCLDQLHFANELTNPDLTAADLSLVQPEVLDLAVQLIDKSSSTFDITNYTDDYMEAFQMMLTSKLANRNALPGAAPAAIVNKPAPDMVEILRASLAETAKKSKQVSKR